MSDVNVLASKLDPAAKLPEYGNPGDGGAELFALGATRLLPGACEAIRTGIALALPDGYVGLIGQALPDDPAAPSPFVVAPSVLDAGFRGEVTVTLHNPHSGESEQITPGQPIGRLVIVPVVRANFAEAEKLPGSMRQ